MSTRYKIETNVVDGSTFRTSLRPNYNLMLVSCSYNQGFASINVSYCEKTVRLGIRTKQISMPQLEISRNLKLQGKKVSQ